MGKRHGTEEPPGLPGQGQDRQEADGDEQEREEGRASDLLDGVDDHAVSIRARRQHGQLARGVLDEGRRGVLELPDGDGDAGERHDVEGHPEVVGRDEGHQHRQRDRHDRYQRRAEVEQEEQADQRDDDPLLDHRPLQRLDRAEDQPRAIIGRDQAHALWEGQARDLLLDRVDDRERVRSDPHDHDPADGLAARVVVGSPAADLRPELGAGDVTEADRRATGADGDDARLEVRELLHIAASAEHILAAGELEHARADLGVRVADRPRDVAEREPEDREPFGVEDDLVLPLEAAQRRDLGDPGHRLQRGADREVLQLSYLRQVERSRRVFEDILEHPADPGRVGSEDRRHVRRQELLRPTELLEHPRARPVDVGAVGEDDVDEAHPEHRVAADRVDLRRALKRADERVGDLVLHEVGAAPHPLGEHDHLRVREVGDRVERRPTHRDERPDDEEQDDAEDQPAVSRRGLDDPLDHGDPPWCCMCAGGAGSSGTCTPGCGAVWVAAAAAL